MFITNFLDSDSLINFFRDLVQRQHKGGILGEYQKKCDSTEELVGLCFCVLALCLDEIRPKIAASFKPHDSESSTDEKNGQNAVSIAQRRLKKAIRLAVDGKTESFASGTIVTVVSSRGSVAPFITEFDELAIPVVNQFLKVFQTKFDVKRIGSQKPMYILSRK